MSCTSPSHLLLRSRSQFGLKQCPSAISCLGCNCHNGFNEILILLQIIILQNKMMCNAHHQATYSQSQCHSLLSSVGLSNISCPGYIFHIPEWNLILLRTIILHNKMMCHAHHPVIFSQGQGHSLGSII